MINIMEGDALETLRTLPDECFHACITSPPYYDLRDYKTANWRGGNPDCEHIATDPTEYYRIVPNCAEHEFHRNQLLCPECGALRIDRQIGFEPTPAAYIDTITTVMDEVWRVLRPDGNLFLNLGDKFAERKAHGRKRGNKLFLPHRIAIAMQDCGWFARQDIIWHKSNSKPESVRNRTSTAHEYIFHFTKRATGYWYDADAVRTPPASSVENQTDSKRHVCKSNGTMKAVGGTYRQKKNRGGKRPEMGFLTRWDSMSEAEQRAHGGNLRSVWSVGISGFKDAHTAVMTERIAETCILAGCPKGGYVLDPFGGSGTTGLIANQLERNATLIELNPDFVALAQQRIGLFAVKTAVSQQHGGR